MSLIDLSCDFKIGDFKFPLSYGESLKLQDTLMNYHGHNLARMKRPFIPFNVNINITQSSKPIKENINGQFLLEIFPIQKNFNKDIFSRIRKLELDNLHNYILSENNYLDYFYEKILSQIKDWIHSSRDEILFFEYSRIAQNRLYQLIKLDMSGEIEEVQEEIMHDLDIQYNYTGTEEFSLYLSRKKEFFIRPNQIEYKREIVLRKIKSLKEKMAKIELPIKTFDWQNFYIKNEDMVRLYSFIENKSILQENTYININKDVLFKIFLTLESKIVNSISEEDIELLYYLEEIGILIYLLSQEISNDDMYLFNLKQKIYNYC